MSQRTTMDEDVNKIYSEARKYYEINPLKSLEILNKLLDNYPPESRFYYLRGLVNMKLKENEDANSDLSFYINLEKAPDAFIYACRGNVKGLANDINGAMVDFQKAISVDKDCFWAFYYRGHLKMNLSDTRGAIIDLTQAIRIKPNDGDSYSVRGTLNFFLKKYGAAISDLTKAIQLGDEKAYYWRGICYIKMDKKDLGCEDLSKAGELGDESAYKEIKLYCN